MRTHNLWMTPKVHVLVYHVPEYVRRSGVPLGSTSEQALEIQHRFFKYFLPQIQSELYEIPRLSRTSAEHCISL